MPVLKQYEEKSYCLAQTTAGKLIKDLVSSNNCNKLHCLLFSSTSTLVYRLQERSEQARVMSFLVI
jgi:hypothetical protein